MQFCSRKDFFILLGNVVDHFDTSIYIFIAPIIAPIFFPNHDPVIQLILTYSIFITSILTRPLGTYMFGALVSFYGPSRTLSYSLMGLGISTMCIGFLPCYDSIGVLSPILLILLHIIRDLCAAGGSVISKVYILYNKTGQEAFTSSYLYHTSTVFGVIVASVLTTLIQYLNKACWWRFVLIMGGIAAIIGYYIRSNIVEFPQVCQKKVLQCLTADNLWVLWQEKINILKITIVNSFSHITYIIPFITMNHIIPLITDINLMTMMILNSMSLFLDMLMIPMIGIYIQRFSIQKIMLVSSGVLAITIIPLWYYINSFSIFYVNFVRLWIVVWGVIFLCPLNAWNNQQVIGNKKYIVIGMGTALSACTIGKLSPSLCFTLYYYYHSHVIIGFYLFFLFSLVFVILYYNKD